MKVAVINLSQKGLKGRFLGPDKLQDLTNEGNGKEKKKEREGRYRGEEKKAMVALLVFIMATLKMLFSRKKTVGCKNSIWR